MGYIKAEHAGFGNEIYVKIRNKLLKAIVVKTPFYKEN
jgi:aminomethyltransferase